MIGRGRKFIDENTSISCEEQLFESNIGDAALGWEADDIGRVFLVLEQHPLEFCYHIEL